MYGNYSPSPQQHLERRDYDYYGSQRFDNGGVGPDVHQGAGSLMGSPVGGGGGPNFDSGPVVPLPVELVLEGTLVGAVIGLQGTNIKAISRESNARILVDTTKVLRNGKELEEGRRTKAMCRVLRIFPAPRDNQDKAVELIFQKVLERQKMDFPLDPESPEQPVELKLRVPRSLMGLLIGKQGCNFKHIQQETGCEAITSSNDYVEIDDGEMMNRFGTGTEQRFFDNFSSGGQMGYDYLPRGSGANFRIVQIKGSVKSVLNAASLICDKMNYCAEIEARNKSRDQQFNQPAQYMSQPPLQTPTMEMLVQKLAISDPRGAGMKPPMPIPGLPYCPMPMQQQTLVDPTMNDYSNVEEVRILVPFGIVGQIIGQSGRNIKKCQELSGAKIRVDMREGDKEKAKNREEKRSGPRQTSEHWAEEDWEERSVSIIGTIVQQEQAQHWVYTVVARGMNIDMEKLNLSVQTQIRADLAGRFVGKEGRNIRFIQEYTGCQVAVAENPKDQPEPPELATVKITGHFPDSQYAQQLVFQFDKQPGIIAHLMANRSAGGQQ